MQRCMRGSAIVRMGVRSWLLVGVIVLAVFVALSLDYVAGFVIPLVVSTVIAMLFHPAVDRLNAWGLPRSFSVILVMLAIIVVALAVMLVAVYGVVNQGSEILAQVQAGLTKLKDFLNQTDLPQGTIDKLTQSAQSAAPKVGLGLASFASSTLSSAISFLFGTFIGVLLLFYLLQDWKAIGEWVGRNLGTSEDMGVAIVSDANGSIRKYYYALTTSSLLVSVTIGLTVALLGLPLASTIALVTFATSYIPYIGAIISGAFAFLVALGSGGLSSALIVLAVIIAMQSVIQTIILNKVSSEKLNVHPIVNLAATIIGGTVLGLVGATLASPVTSVALSTYRRFRDSGSSTETGAAVQESLQGE